MKPRKFRVVFEPEEGGWLAHVPEVRGCRTWARGLVEARRNIRAALASRVDVFGSSGEAARLAATVVFDEDIRPTAAQRAAAARASGTATKIRGITLPAWVDRIKAPQLHDAVWEAVSARVHALFARVARFPASAAAFERADAILETVAEGRLAVPESRRAIRRAVHRYEAVAERATRIAAKRDTAIRWPAWVRSLDARLAVDVKGALLAREAAEETGVPKRGARRVAMENADTTLEKIAWGRVAGSRASQMATQAGRTYGGEGARPTERFIYAVTVLGHQATRPPDRQTRGWWPSRAETEAAMRERDNCFFENGTYEYAVIEQLRPGLDCRPKTWWFRADYTEASDLYVVEALPKPPEFARRMRNFAMS